MKTKKTKPLNNRVIVTKAREVLAFAEEFAPNAKYYSELFNALFAPGGKATELFTSQNERRAHAKTPEYKKVFKLLNTLPKGPLLDEVYEIDLPNKRVTIRRGSKVISVQPIVD